jgi:hypothetical protein
MIKDMEVYRLNGKIVFTGVWDDSSKDLPEVPTDWVKSIEPVEEMADGTYLAVADYKARRKYPTIEEQLDYIYHNGIDKWRDELIKPIKDANPKL